jgi:hypothetical protein
MCAVCGCLTTKSPAPEEGTYRCKECDASGKSVTAKLKEGDPMPSCSACGVETGHWVKVQG